MNLFNSLFFLSLFFLSFFKEVIGQTDSTSISGKVTDVHSDRPIQNIDVLLFENQDTLMVIKTDSLGEFKFFVKVSPQKDYTLKTECYPRSFIVDTIEIVPNKEGIKYEYFIETSCFYYNDKPKDLVAYYEVGDTKSFSRFNIGYLKDLMQEYPKMCLQASPFHVASENKKTVNSRIHNFKDSLIQSDIDLSRIAFSSSRVIENDTEKSADKQQSKIYFEVTRMDGDCKE